MSPVILNKGLNDSNWRGDEKSKLKSRGVAGKMECEYNEYNESLGKTDSIF